MINGFLNDTLTVEELDQYLKHLRSCPECREELEMYFILYRTLAQLDEDDLDDTMDMRRLLNMEIRRREQRLRRIQAGRFLGKVILGLICILAAIFLWVVAIEVRNFL